MAPIPSGYETDCVFRLDCESGPARITWRLREEKLSVPLRKRYDSGEPKEWLASYEESVAHRDLRFLAAFEGRRVEGLITWQQLEWNGTLWLIDIRVRQSLRRGGIGSALVGRLKGIAEDQRMRGISVETQTANYPAIRFYRKHGFEVAGFNDHLYSNDDLERQEVALYLFWETGRH